MGEVAIRVRDLRKIYPGRGGPVVAVDGLDLDVIRGECFGLLGPNGAGKTTTIEIIEGLTLPTAGEVEVLGMRWDRHDAKLRARLGVTLQKTVFPDKSTVFELVRMFRSFYPSGLEPAAVLAKVGLEGKSNAYVETLSGGQAQRLAVALALVGDPDIVFLDEPTTGLDPQSRRRLWEVIDELQGQGRTIVLTTHYMDEAERLCDRIAIVDHGKVIALGSPAELIAKLGGEHVVEFGVVDAGGDLPAAEGFADLPSVIHARPEVDGYTLTVHEPHVTIPALLGRLAGRGLALARLATRQVSLEDVFVELTGRHLREDGPEAAPAAEQES